ncbi:MAG: hypothetical protein DMG75_11785 [Acidobacteria bacterium]|nr:MAG: hypothetical protein DMG75_11785 [Acidobacteriota bacterium]
MQGLEKCALGFFYVPIAVARADEGDAIAGTVDGFHRQPGVAFILAIGGRDLFVDGIEVCAFFRFHLDSKYVEIFFLRLLSLADRQHR